MLRRAAPSASALGRGIGASRRGRCLNGATSQRAPPSSGPGGPFVHAHPHIHSLFFHRIRAAAKEIFVPSIGVEKISIDFISRIADSLHAAGMGAASPQ
jgi:hypothetical protein